MAKTISRRKSDFRRLARARMNKLIKSFELIGNLSNQHLYMYTDEEVNQMRTRVDKEVQQAFKQLRNRTTRPKAEEFTLNDFR
tara:strand:+ start:144 stop:392 length:249 start_codon:yes stop_codon:yes gene_type:complete